MCVYVCGVWDGGRGGLKEKWREDMCIKVILVLIRCASRITHGKNWHYGRILNAHVIQKFLYMYSVVTRASYRGGGGEGGPGIPPPPPRNLNF